MFNRHHHLIRRYVAMLFRNIPMLIKLLIESLTTWGRLIHLSLGCARTLGVLIAYTNRCSLSVAVSTLVLDNGSVIVALGLAIVLLVLLLLIVLLLLEAMVATLVSAILLILHLNL